jgi:hypothetical protein
MSKFTYDVLILIEFVESKPCLWDKTTDCFKDKLEKQKAWMEVYTFLEQDFLQMDKKEQQKIGKIYFIIKIIIIITVYILLICHGNAPSGLTK